MRKAFKKIHLWLSVPFGIIITLICLSGAALVFEQEITEACNHSTYYVETGNQAIPVDKLLDKVASTLPDSVSITGVTISENPQRAYQVNLSKPRRASVYVNQYTGEITGSGQRLPFFDKMFRLHRWLLGSAGNNGQPSVGKLLVGTATLLLIFILITGLVIWLTNKKKPLTQSLKISVTKGWPRFWHDLHVAGGIYATIFLLACAITGLTWSFSWYRTGFYSLLGVEQTAEHGGHGNQGGNSEKAHAAENTALAENSEKHAFHGQGRDQEHGQAMGQGQHFGKNHGKLELQNDSAQSFHEHSNVAETVSQYAIWQRAMNNVVAQAPNYRQLTISNGYIAVVPQGRDNLRAGDNYLFDAATGSIKEVKLYADQEKATKVRSAIYNIHTGNWLGMFSRIITLLAALIGATLPLTGYYIWIKHLRRKKTK